MKLLLLATFTIAFCFSGHPANSFAQNREWNQLAGPWGTGSVEAFTIASNGHLFAVSSSRMFRSTDRGVSWHELKSIKPHYGNPVMLVALGNGELFYCPVRNDSSVTIYVSSDDGESWIESLHGYVPQAICLDSSSTVKVIANLPVFAVKSLIRSTDGGKHWTFKPLSGSDPFSASFALGTDVFTFAANDISPQLNVIHDDGSISKIDMPGGFVIPMSGNKLGCFSVNRYPYNWMDSFWISDDHLTWHKGTSLHLPSTISEIVSVNSSGGMLAHSLMSDTVFSSVDFGGVWRKWPVSAFPRAFDASNSIYAGSQAGIFRSDDGTTTSSTGWIPIKSVGGIGASNGLLFVANDQIYFSRDAGLTWTGSKLDKPYFPYFCTHPTNGHPVFTKIYNDVTTSLFIADSDTWRSGPSAPLTGVSFVDNDFAGNIYAGTDFMSSDGGISWTETGFPDKHPGTGFAATSEGFIFESSIFPVVYRSSDAGQTWKKLFVNIPGISIVKMAAEAGSLVATTKQNVVIRSDDNGESWYTWLTGLSDTCNALVITRIGEVFMGGPAGLHYCNLSDNELRTVDLGLYDPWILGLAVMDGTGVLVQTIFDGVYFSNGGGSFFTDPSAFGNYPNPFHQGSTTITFRLTTAGYTSLKIYNEIGQRIATVADGNLERGVYTFDFKTQLLDCHVYFAQLISPSGKTMLKMVGGQ